MSRRRKWTRFGSGQTAALDVTSIPCSTIGNCSIAAAAAAAAAGRDGNLTLAVVEAVVTETTKTRSLTDVRCAVQQRFISLLICFLDGNRFPSCDSAPESQLIV
jgi:hypothetical protein